MRATVQFEMNTSFSADDTVRWIEGVLDYANGGISHGPVRVSIEADEDHEDPEMAALRLECQKAWELLQRPIRLSSGPTTANRLLCSHCLKEVGGELSTLCSFNGKRVCEGCSSVIDAGVDQHGYVVLSNAALKLLGEIHCINVDMGIAGDRRDGDLCDRLEESLDRAHENLRKEMTK